MKNQKNVAKYGERKGTLILNETQKTDANSAIKKVEIDFFEKIIKIIKIIGIKEINPPL
jgi:hypothetical protein